MVYTPYDWMQTLHQKADYVEDRLRSGSPVVGLSCREGVLLLTIRGSQRKIYEIYDRLAFSALGQQVDIEALRTLAVDFAHVEGYQRSPDDVSIQRVVGFAISPVVRRTFSEPFRTPLVVRALFAQLGDVVSDDVFYVLNYDGEFTLNERIAVIAGTTYAEKQMHKYLEGEIGDKPPTLKEAVPVALNAWAIGRFEAEQGGEGEDASDESEQSYAMDNNWRDVLKRELKGGVVEVALLDRRLTRERKFRLLTDKELRQLMPAKRSGREA
ncbi:MAG TPA: hypothetical protein EYP10_02985 [Armatimonadetes bacterium]|nr:hypothetical protein [Armatimonadota bacterium]